jgi:hypothetical protein
MSQQVVTTGLKMAEIMFSAFRILILTRAPVAQTIYFLHLDMYSTLR